MTKIVNFVLNNNVKIVLHINVYFLESTYCLEKIFATTSYENLLCYTSM